jgi:hypothetical protein
LAVRGDIRALVLRAEKISLMAEKLFASLLGQPFVLAKIMTSKIPDHDVASSLVIHFATKRQCQIKVRKSRSPSRMGTIGLTKAMPQNIFAVVSIFDFQIFP